MHPNKKTFIDGLKKGTSCQPEDGYDGKLFSEECVDISEILDRDKVARYHCYGPQNLH